MNTNEVAGLLSEETITKIDNFVRKYMVAWPADPLIIITSRP